MKSCLTIAGSDCSGGAGIQADLKAFSANGAFGMSVIVSVVAENTSRVISIHDLPAEIIRDQIDAVFEDMPVDAVKVGMLSSRGVMEAVAEKLWQYRPDNVVVDPVMEAKGGCALMRPDALDYLREKIIPLAYLLTPNIPEAQAITGLTIRGEEEMRAAAQKMHALGAQNVLVKGGHLKGNALDLLFDGERFYRFDTPRIPSRSTHGTGCTLSSAIAANLSNGLALDRAVEEAKRYVTMAISHAFPMGKGHGPTNHFYDYYRMKGIQ